MLKTSGRKAAAAAAVACALALALAGCGGGSGGASAPTAVALPNSNGQVATDGSGGYTLPDCTGSDPSACVYEGFVPAVNGFSFANWADVGALDATALVGLFGETAVCAEVTDAGCVVYPAAQQWADQVNQAMTGGHCEGMATLAQRLFSDPSTLADIDPAAKSVFDLSKDDPKVTGAIEFWWATQMLAPVQEAYMAFHELEPSEVAQKLAAGLASGENYTLAIYSQKGSGHSITPIAVVYDGKTYAISVYDNNYPGSVQQVLVDAETEHWSYAAGATSPGAPTSGWEGGKATIDLTPMSARAIPASAPFTDGAAKGAARTNAQVSNVLVTSADPGATVGVVLTIDGKTYDTTDPTVDLPEGVSARPLLGDGMAGNGVNVFIDRSRVPEFDADGTARSRETGEPQDNADYTMSIDTDGAPRVTVSTQTGPRPDGGATIRANNEGRVDVQPPPGRDSNVNFANGANSFSAPIPDGGRFNVGPNDRRGEAPVGFTDGQGRERPGFQIPRENPGGRVVDTQGRFDPNNGGFVATERFGKPEPVDGARVDEFRAMAGPQPGGGPTGGPGPGQTPGPEANGGPAGPAQPGAGGGPTPGPTGSAPGGGGGAGAPADGSGGGATPGPTGGDPAGGGGGAPAGGAPAGGGGGGAPAGGDGGGGGAPAGPAPAGPAPAGPGPATGEQGPAPA